MRAVTNPPPIELFLKKKIPVPVEPGSSRVTSRGWKNGIHGIVVLLFGASNVVTKVTVKEFTVQSYSNTYSMI